MDNEPETPPQERSSTMTPDQTDNATHIWPRQTEAYKKLVEFKLPQNSPGKTDSNTNPLTTITANVTDKEIDHSIDDAKQANEERLIRDDNG